MLGLKRRSSDWQRIGQKNEIMDDAGVVKLGVPGRSRRGTDSPICPWALSDFSVRNREPERKSSHEKERDFLWYTSPINPVFSSSVSMRIRPEPIYSPLRFLTIFFFIVSAVLLLITLITVLS